MSPTLIAILGFYSIPWMLAGLIYPPAAGIRGLSRGKVLLIGITTLLMALIVATLLSEPQSAQRVEASDVEITLMALWLLSCIAWPFSALVLRMKARAKKVTENGIAIHAKPWEGNHQPASSTIPIQRTKQSSSKPNPKQNRTSRAIQSGWGMGEVEFIYEDSEGNITRRRVTVHAVDSTYLKGECHERKAERTFKLDRIVGDLVDCNTGEIVGPRQWARKRSPRVR